MKHNTAGTAGAGDLIVYTIHVNGLATALTVSLAATSGGAAFDLVNSVTIAQGALVSLAVTKPLAIGTSPVGIFSTLELAPLPS